MILIGEKLNGSIPSVAKAVAERNVVFLSERARLQSEAGADFLDICASVAPEQELATLRWMIELVQGITSIPLCIDSPDPDVLIAAMPYAARPGLLNSVSMEGDKTDRIFPNISGTDWKCIALLCDNSGIPETPEKRLDILKQILSQAHKYGVSEKQLFVDPLVSSLSVSDQAGTVFLETCRMIRSQYPELVITSGLSNISFGLPERKSLNHAFALLALEAGMNSAILDPTDTALRNLLLAGSALLGNDARCSNYISGITGSRKISASSPSKDDTSLALVHQAVLNGNPEECQNAVKAAISAGCSAESILADGMSLAMNKLGEAFSKGDVFVPELMMAAKAMKKGIEILRPHLTSASSQGRGTVIIGTVAGDMHDIGKNLVAMMLESSGFTVVDLGVDVAPDDFIQAVNMHPDVKIVALSTLLTTTMPSMKITVQKLRSLENRSFKILIGGAPVTQSFADKIGADAYSKDAAEAAQTAVRIAQEI